MISRKQHIGLASANQLPGPRLDKNSRTMWSCRLVGPEARSWLEMSQASSANKRVAPCVEQGQHHVDLRICPWGLEDRGDGYTSRFGSLFAQFNLGSGGSGSMDLGINSMSLMWNVLRKTIAIFPLDTTDWIGMKCGCEDAICLVSMSEQTV